MLVLELLDTLSKPPHIPGADENLSMQRRGSSFPTAHIWSAQPVYTCDCSVAVLFKPTMLL